MAAELINIVLIKINLRYMRLNFIPNTTSVLVGRIELLRPVRNGLGKHFGPGILCVVFFLSTFRKINTN
jgi:hypothetical protein